MNGLRAIPALRAPVETIRPVLRVGPITLPPKDNSLGARAPVRASDFPTVA